MPFTIIRKENKELTLLVNGFDMGPFYITNDSQYFVAKWEELGKLEYIDLSSFKDTKSYKSSNMKKINPKQVEELLSLFDNGGRHDTE